MTLTRLISIIFLTLTLTTCGQKSTDNKKLTVKKEKELFRKENIIKSKTTWGFSGQDRVKIKKIRRTFNQDGKDLSFEIFKFRSDSVKSKKYTHYNDKGQPIEEGWIKKGESKPNRIYKYDNDGNLIEDIGLTDDGGVLVKSVNEYNSDGVRLIEKLYNSKDVLEKEFINDIEGKRTKAIVYDENGILNYTVNYKYDNRNNVIREKYLDNKGNLNQEVIYNYDNEGNKTIQVLKDGTGKEKEKILYSYDQNGNQISYKHYINGLLSKEATYEYDENGNLIYDGFKNERYKYNDKNLKIEKGAVLKDGTYKSEELYEYTFFE